MFTLVDIQYSMRLQRICIYHGKHLHLTCMHTYSIQRCKYLNVICTQITNTLPRIHAHLHYSANVYLTYTLTLTGIEHSRHLCLSARSMPSTPEMSQPDA